MTSFFVNLIEFFVGKKHWQNFKSYLKEGGILKILERSTLKLEKVEYLKGGLLVAVKSEKRVELRQSHERSKNKNS
jgi:hypothetical protein